MARPTKAPEERRDGQLGVRLTVAERARLEHTAAAHGLTMAEFMRRRALGYRLPANAAAQQHTARAATALIRLGVNLNQIARHMNTGRGAPPHLSALIDRINGELDRLYGPGDNGGGPVL